MNIRLVNDEYADITLIENEDSLYNTILAINSINEFFIDSVCYQRSNNKINLNLDNNCIEVFIKES